MMDTLYFGDDLLGEARLSILLLHTSFLIAFGLDFCYIRVALRSAI